MKKNMIAAAILTLSIFYPMASHAYATPLEDQLAQFVAQDAKVAQVQDLIKIKQQLAQVKTDTLITTIARNAVGHQEQPAFGTGIVAGNIQSVAQNAVRQEVEKRIEETLVSNKDEFSILSLLLKEASILTPSVAAQNNSLTGAPQNYHRILDMTATAYGPGTLDNGKWNNQTYMGGLVQKGVVAVDPHVIPMGTKLWVEGYGEAIATDQGSAIKGNRIDLAFNTRQEALDYGIQNVKVYMLN